MEKKNKQIIIIAVIAFIVLFAVGFYFYRRGKKQVTIQAPPADNPGTPGSGTTVPANNPYAVSSAEISQLSDDLYQEMDGANIWRDTTPYKKLMTLSDTDFVRVYNKFNTDHQAEGEGTLKGWLESEYGVGEWATLQDTILSRMGRLNLI